MKNLVKIIFQDCQVLKNNTCEISRAQLVDNGTGVQGWGAEEFRISVDLECSNCLKLDHSECLNICLFHI